MEQRNKNILIGGLLAVVLVMAVGYAAFATTLNINGTATIDSTWDVHFNPAYATGGASATQAIVATKGLLQGDTTTSSATTAPTGEIQYDANNLTATLTTHLQQPGDTVVYTLKPHNYGSISAVSGTPTIQVTDTTDGNQTVNLAEGKYKYGNMSYTWEFTPGTTLSQGDEDTITITVTYEQPAQNSVVAQQTMTLVASIPYTQAS